MMVTFQQFKRDIFTLVFPDGMAEHRVPLFRNFVVNSLIQMQTFCESYQLTNVNFYDKDQCWEDCGLSIVQGCRGQQGAVYAFDPSCRCQRYFYEAVSLEKMACLYERCRCAQSTACCGQSTSLSVSPYTQNPVYCGDYVGGNDGCSPPRLEAQPEDPCSFKLSERYFAVGPGNKIWLYPRWPCSWILGVHFKAIRRSYLDNDYVLDDDDLKDAVACYVESEVARRVDKDQATADKLYADYRMKAGDIIFREEQDLKPRATRICIEGLDLSELVQIYPDNPYPTQVGQVCAEETGVATVETFLNAAQTFVAECAEGNTGEPIEVTIAAGAYSSLVSQEDANALALAAATEQAQAALECTPVVSTPVLLLGTASATDNILVNWTQGIEPGTSEVWKSINGGAYALLSTVDGSLLQYANAGSAIPGGAVWCYKVRGINGATEGDFSNIGCAVRDYVILGTTASQPTYMLAFGDIYCDDNLNVTSLSYPGLLRIYGALDLDNTLRLQALNLNSLISIGGAFGMASSGSSSGTPLAVLSLPALVSIGADFTLTFAEITTLTLPVLVSVTGDILCDDCPNLVTVSMPNFVMSNGRTYAFDNCKLNAASVNHILARARASPGLTTAQLYLDSGTNAAPSGQGIADKAALILAGNTVTSN